MLRIYEEVFGVEGGFEAVRVLADRNRDPVADRLYGALEEVVEEMARKPDEDAFLEAVVAYHLLAEGVVARAAQNLAAAQYERFGAFPGLLEGQRLVARDEARHIGFGVSYVRRRVAAGRERGLGVVGEVIEEFAAVAADLLETASTGMRELVLAGYGVEPEGFHAEAMRLLRIRLRSIGFLAERV